MPHSTIAKPNPMPPSGQAVPNDMARPLSDAERMAQGRAQIAEGDFIEGEDLAAFLDSLKIPSAKA